ncbi:DUF7103 family protein [Lutibacter maritimus]|jgi:hypothetical protein|uniref:Uncharacterized protein n=1 Tax=Lutibacter maritimus TaxID=593133 RepID=A0A1I6NSH7_9FLAO|nr:hypothetical protein [Lutibacter maritimus]SFS30874.1 hypothetical protein SAMN04488006_0499 [Lutibacter maritimus]
MNLRNRLFNYEKWLVVLLLTMPIVLIAFDNGIVRNSISNYVYMQHNQVYYFLLIISASMFGYSGAIWRKNYNIILGALLAGVVLTPHLSFPTLHFTLAGLFFAYSIVVMILYSSKEQRKFKIYAAAFIVIGMLGHFVFEWYSLLIAEWLGVVPIAIHFIGETLGKID